MTKRLVRERMGRATPTRIEVPLVNNYKEYPRCSCRDPSIKRTKRLRYIPSYLPLELARSLTSAHHRHAILSTILHGPFPGPRGCRSSGHVCHRHVTGTRQAGVGRIVNARTLLVGIDVLPGRHTVCRRLIQTTIARDFPCVADVEPQPWAEGKKKSSR